MFFSTAATEEGERLDAILNGLEVPYHDAFIQLLSDALDAARMESTDAELMFSMLVNAITKTVAYIIVVAFLSRSDLSRHRDRVFNHPCLPVAQPDEMTAAHSSTSSCSHRLP